jgi:hypothetical protein
MVIVIRDATNIQSVLYSADRIFGHLKKNYSGIRRVVWFKPWFKRWFKPLFKKKTIGLNH